MSLFDLFRKNKVEKKSYSKQSEKLGDVYQIIDNLGGEDNIKEVVSDCKRIINIAIKDGGANRKTDLLLCGMEMTLEGLEKAKSNPKINIGTSSITSFIYYRFFLDCVLAIDNDILQISELYTTFKIFRSVPSDMHPYVKMIIRIYDLLDRGIVYLSENMDTVSEDYFTIVSEKISNILNDYEDDSTGWNKIATWNFVDDD